MSDWTPGQPLRADASAADIWNRIAARIRYHRSIAGPWDFERQAAVDVALEYASVRERAVLCDALARLAGDVGCGTAGS